MTLRVVKVAVREILATELTDVGLYRRIARAKEW